MRAGPLDNGKMWLFEEPPTDYLAETYDFHPDAAWFERARLSALKLSGCSAAFVSASGLIATNHHCVRSLAASLSKPGERLLDEGFFARSLDEERRAPGLWVDQLVEVEDVTARVQAAVADAQTDAERADARRTVIEAIQSERTATESEGDAAFHTEVVSLYQGGRYSAYTYRRYDDLRLVAAPELQLGYFGGDADNYSYPRYALDFAFLRAYDADGEPLDTSDFYFPWSTDGVEAGDLVFVIGTPGGTFRGETVAQLEWRRDVEVPSRLQHVRGRMAALRAYLDEHPDDDAYRAQFLSLSNTEKRYAGRQDALDNAVIMSRRRDFEAGFQQALDADAALQTEYGDLIQKMADIQREKRDLASLHGALERLGERKYIAPTLLRGIYAAQLLGAQQAGTNPELQTQLEAGLRDVGDRPGAINRGYLAAQLEELQQHLDPALVDPFLAGRTPEAAADALINGSVLQTKASTAEALASGTLGADDPVVRLALAILPRYADYQSAAAGLGEQEREVAAGLGAARFAVYGTTVPPDGSLSLRISDGVVQGYAYNGTVAPPYTSFYGLYDRNAAFGQDSEWKLPKRWLPAPPDLDLATPLDFVSTADAVGGSSGSPTVDRDLRLVGINFDRTVEGLSRDFIYFADRGRNIMVDARAVVEALDTVYDLDRIVWELKTGEAVATEAEADAQTQP